MGAGVQAGADAGDDGAGEELEVVDAGEVGGREHGD